MLLQKMTDAIGCAQPMNKATKLLFYGSMAVVGWQVLSYFYRRVVVSAAFAVEPSYARDGNAYRRATERWENEGGATCAGQTGCASHSK